MGLFKKGAQYHEYIGIKNEVMNCYNPKSKSCYLSQFETDEEKVRAFINNFFKYGILNKTLSDKLYKSFNDGTFILDNKEAGENRHIFEQTGNDITIKTIKRAKLGDELNEGKVSTNMRDIRGIIHENSHSVSQKFDKNYLNSTETKQKILSGKPFEKDRSTGEIESKFIEKVFNHYILNNGSELEKLGITPSKDISLEEEIRNLNTYDTLDFLERLSQGMKKDDPKYKQSTDHRYIIGTVLSSILFEEYKKSPEETLVLFNNYLENQCNMDINEVSEYLTKGKAKDFGQAIELYKNLLQEKSKFQSQNVQKNN